MFGITAARALRRARQAKQGSAQCIDPWPPLKVSAPPHRNGHAAGVPAPAPSRNHPNRRLVWRTHGTPPAWIETAA